MPSRQQVLDLISEQAAAASRVISGEGPGFGAEASAPWDGRLEVYVGRVSGAWRRR